ncbi:MAG: SurA N-terminal domain-containing protein [Acidobacteria bacterium]|nr:SurA N-terminal domain-containing protein [Acidobacteriota bacterium]
MRNDRTLLLLLAALVLLPGTPAAAQAKKPAQALPAPAAKPSAAAPAGKTVLQDRVLAVVDEDPVLASDVERVLKLGLQPPNPGESDDQYRKRVLNSLVEERLRFHEIDRYGFEQVPVDEIEKAVAKVRAGFKDEASFQKALKEVGLTPKGLRQLMARQLLVLTYVDERLGPRVFVTFDDINKYYRTVLAPEMQKKGQPVPPLEEVREDVREVLKQQKLTQELQTWTEELRAKADVVIYPNQPGNAPLPPVVKKIDATTAKKAETKSAPPKGPTRPPG